VDTFGGDITDLGQVIGLFHRRTRPLPWSRYPEGMILPIDAPVVGENHDLLQARRIEQKSEAFKERMHQRNGIEGTIRELTRAHGMRRNPYRGLAKARFENLFIATACKIKQWLKLERAKRDESASYFPAEALRKAFDCTLSAILGSISSLKDLADSISHYLLVV
jgi:hypothetical protein